MRGPVRMFRHGWQSWSPSDHVVLGEASDPGGPGSIELVREVFLADPSEVTDGTVRSSLVTTLEHADGVLLVGFLGGAEHEGTVRARAVPGGVELVVEADLGGAVLAPGEERELHPFVVRSGHDADALLRAWADDLGTAAGARATGPRLVGWCSWYHWFTGITEAELRRTLALLGDWPFDVVQLDDGWQRAMGDWLHTNDDFPSPLHRLAADIAATGRAPGIWLAPFIADPATDVAARPGWAVADAVTGAPRIGAISSDWPRPMQALDTTHPEVLDHLTSVTANLVDAGWRYLKLDFLFAAALPGRHHDPSRTPSQRVRLGLDAIRRGAGDDVVLLGCGCPLGPAVGVVDAMRVGPDVAPFWDPLPADVLPGFEGAPRSLRNAWQGSAARWFQHGRLWRNDPDCVLLRGTETELTSAQRESWAEQVGAWDGSVLVSDDLALLGPTERTLLERVLRPT